MSEPLNFTSNSQQSLFSTTKIISNAYHIFHDTKPNERTTCDFFLSPSHLFLFTFMNIEVNPTTDGLPNILHSAIGKTSIYKSIPIETVIQVRQDKYVGIESERVPYKSSDRPPISRPVVYPKSRTSNKSNIKDGMLVVLAPNDEGNAECIINTVMVDEKNQKLYIGGKFKYLVINPRHNSVNVNITGKTTNYEYNLTDYHNESIVRVYKNIIRTDLNGNLDLSFYPFSNPQSSSDQGVKLDGEVFCIKGVGHVNAQFFDKNDQTVFIGGNFTGYIKKINANGQEIPWVSNPGLNGPVHTIELDPTRPYNPNNHSDMRIYLGGAFTNVGSMPTNSYLTRIRGDGTLQPLIMPLSANLILDGIVRSIMFCQYHTEGGNQIIFIGGDFNTFNSNNIRKCAKILFDKTGDIHSIDVNFKPIQDTSPSSKVCAIEEYHKSTWDYILIGGEFSNVGNDISNIGNFCRVQISNGQLDKTFSTGYPDPFSTTIKPIGYNRRVNRIKLYEYPTRFTQGSNANVPLDLPYNESIPWQSRIYVCGGFTQYKDNTLAYYLTRIYNNGNYRSYQEYLMNHYGPSRIRWVGRYILESDWAN